MLLSKTGRDAQGSAATIEPQPSSSHPFIHQHSSFAVYRLLRKGSTIRRCEYSEYNSTRNSSFAVARTLPTWQMVLNICHLQPTIFINQKNKALLLISISIASNHKAALFHSSHFCPYKYMERQSLLLAGPTKLTHTRLSFDRRTTPYCPDTHSQCSNSTMVLLSIF